MVSLAFLCRAVKLCYCKILLFLIGISGWYRLVCTVAINSCCCCLHYHIRTPDSLPEHYSWHYSTVYNIDGNSVFNCILGLTIVLMYICLIWLTVQLGLLISKFRVLAIILRRYLKSIDWVIANICGVGQLYSSYWHVMPSQWAAIASHAALKDREVAYICPSVASNNVKSIGKSIDVKVLALVFAKISVLVSAILSAQSFGIIIGSIFANIVNKPAYSA